MVKKSVTHVGEYVLLSLGLKEAGVLLALEFLTEVTRALSGLLDVSSLGHLEDEMVLPFLTPDPARNWREGVQKVSFIYLLLDPRITQNLPVRAKTMGVLLRSYSIYLFNVIFSILSQFRCFHFCSNMIAPG